MLSPVLLLTLLLTAHQQCTNSSQAIIHTQFSQPYSSVSSQLAEAFRMYIIGGGSLANVAMQLKPYVIPIIIMVVLQIVCILAVVGQKIHRCRMKEQEISEYSKGTTVGLMVVAGIVATALLSLGILITLGSLSTDKYNDDAQCSVQQAVGHFLTGQTDKWIGVENVAEQATKASLSFNNNIRQMKLGLTGLTKNGSGLGLPITPFTTMEAYMNNALITRAVNLNTSANSRQFPICQTNPTLLPSPAVAGQKVRLTYPDTICNDLKAESQVLVDQAKSLDMMNSHMTNLIGNRTNIVNNVTALASSYSNYINSSNFNSVSLSIDASTGKMLSYALTALLSLLVLGYLIILVTRSQTLIKIYPILYVLTPIVTILAAVQSVYYLTAGASIHASCSLFDQAKTDPSLYASLTSSYGSTLDPLYFCLTNPTATFLNSSSMQDSLAAVGNLTQLQTHYKNALPDSVLQSKSIAYIDQIGGYLSDLSTVPTNGTVSVADALIKLNQIGDYTYSGSTQSASCNISRDQFVFAPKKCTRPLLDPNNNTEVTSNSPFCIQLPTNNRTSSLVNTSLNQMQHLYTLTAGDCSSIPGIFDPTKNCFLKQRSTALFSTCPTVQSDYATMLNRTVSFSYLAGQYTDSYMQNLRNYLGIYLTVSSNMSSFYLSYNISDMVSSITNNVTNISNLSSCQYPFQTVHIVKDQFCNELAPSFFMTSLFGLLAVATTFFMTGVVILVEPRMQLFMGVKVTSEQKIRIQSQIDLNQDRLHEHTMEPLGIMKNLERMELYEDRKEDSGRWAEIRMEEHKVLEESKKHSAKMSEISGKISGKQSQRKSQHSQRSNREEISKNREQMEREEEKHSQKHSHQHSQKQSANSHDQLQPADSRSPIQTLIIQQKVSRINSAKNNIPAPKDTSSKSSQVKKAQSESGQQLDMIYQFQEPPIPVADGSNSHILEDPVIEQINLEKREQTTIPTQSDYERQFKNSQFSKKPRNLILGITMKKVFGRQEDDSSAMSIQDLKIEGSDDEKYNKTTLKKRRPSNED